MSYSRRQLYAMGEPLGDSATYRKADGGLVLGDGGGGGGGQGELPEKTVTNIVELPGWARQYAQDTLAKGAALTDINKNPYQQYGGERNAGFSNLQQQTFQQVGPQGFNKTVGQYMSPYVNNVINQQIAASNRGYDISAAQEQAKATQQGAFGGGRQAIMAAENERARNSANQNIVAQGLQNAYQGATQQYNTGLQQQSQLGGQQQAQAQRGLDTAYQDFLNQQNYPYQQLSYMSNLIRGTPMGQQSTNQVYQAQPSAIQNIGALGLGAIGLASAAKAMGANGGLASDFAEGGMSQGYADGGMIQGYSGESGSLVRKMHTPEAMIPDMSALSDAQLVERIQHPSTQAEAEAARNEMNTRASLRRGLAGAVPPMMADDIARGANGGIVAFAGDDEENDPLTGQLISDNSSAGYTNTPLQRQMAQRFFAAQDRLEKGDYGYTAPTTEKRIAAEDAEFNRMQSRLGPDIYGSTNENLQQQAKDIQANRYLGHASAAFDAMGALLEGRGPRAFGRAASVGGRGLVAAAQAEQSAKTALNNAQFNLANAQRQEKAGLFKEADASVQRGELNKLAGAKLLQQRDQLLASNYARGMQAARTAGGAGGAAKPPKLPERLYDANLANLMSTEKPAAGESEVAFKNRINAKAGELTARQVKDLGQNRMDVEGAKIASREDSAIADKLSAFRFSSDYLNAKDKEAALDNYEMQQRRLYRSQNKGGSGGGGGGNADYSNLWNK